MADGLNDVRAWRLIQILNDYRTTQSYLASIRASPSAESYNEDGYVVLRDCVTQAQALLSRPFPAENGSGNDEQAKAHLRRVIIDAGARRFQAYKLYLRASAAQRWAHARAQILQQPNNGHAAALLAIRNTLHQELAAITDAMVEFSLRDKDVRDRKWVAEDPSLQTIQSVLGMWH